VDIEGLPEDMKDGYYALKHGAYTIECEVTDALDQANDLSAFKEAVKVKMQDLISEAQGIIATFCDEPNTIVLDAKKYAIWINGLAAAPRAQNYCVQYKTLWDIPFSYLPEYIFESGFEIAKQQLPSDGACVNISYPAARELNISWINVPEGEVVAT
jgi:hypothetical protein